MSEIDRPPFNPWHDAGWEPLEKGNVPVDHYEPAPEQAPVTPSNDQPTPVPDSD